jgi:hypothetical protein
MTPFNRQLKGTTMLRLTILALALFAATPALAGDRCQTLQAAEAETIADSRVLGGEVIRLSGYQAHQYLDVVNAVPPQTHLDAEGVMLLVIPNQGAVIGLVESSNVCIAGHIGAAVHEKALRAARGSAA